MNLIHTVILSAACCTLLAASCTKPVNKEKTAAKGEVVDTISSQVNNGPFSGSHFSEHIRSTKARTPEEERLGFKLPPGFEIELFASEPEIGKPINIAFDAQGRLWVTQSFEYPFAAAPGKGKDRLTILEDRDNDGKADHFIKFNDTLNIPIGILPIHGGAVAYSIPHVYQFTDAEGD